MMFNISSGYIYVKVGVNKFTIKLIESNIELKIELKIIAKEPFTTDRLLVGNFTNAEKLLEESIKNLYKPKWFRPTPPIIIQPLYMIDGGLSEVEERAIYELALDAGARRAIVWVGHELTNEEVIELFKDT